MASWSSTTRMRTELNRTSLTFALEEPLWANRANNNLALFGHHFRHWVPSRLFILEHFLNFLIGIIKSL